MTAFSRVSIEQVKDYWDRRPFNIRHSPKPASTKEYFEEVKARKYFVEPHIPGFAQFERWRGKKVLEIGCGIGTDTISFARSAAFVTAVELSEKSLEDSIPFYRGSAEELSTFLPIEPYDLIYSFGGFHQTPTRNE